MDPRCPRRNRILLTPPGEASKIAPLRKLRNPPVRRRAFECARTSMDSFSLRCAAKFGKICNTFRVAIDTSPNVAPFGAEPPEGDRIGSAICLISWLDQAALLAAATLPWFPPCLALSLDFSNGRSRTCAASFPLPFRTVSPSESVRNGSSNVSLRSMCADRPTWDACREDRFGNASQNLSLPQGSEPSENQRPWRSGP